MEIIPKENISVSINNSPKFPESKNILLMIKNIYKDEDKKMIVENTKLKLRDNFHITLIGNEDAPELKRQVITLYEQKNLKKVYRKIKEDVKQLIEICPIIFTKQYHILKKSYPEETRISIIQILKTDLLKKFRKIMQSKYNIKISKTLPEPHITMYKQESNLGIGLYEKGDLEKYSIKKLKSLQK